MQHREFRRRVSLRRAEVVGEQTGLLVSGSHEAIAVLQDEMRTAPKSVDRTRAAGLLLSHALRFRHAFELEGRLRAVEARLGLGATAQTEDVDDDDDDDAEQHDEERDAAFERDRDENDDGEAQR